jgi:hypothetical protein
MNDTGNSATIRNLPAAGERKDAGQQSGTSPPACLKAARYYDGLGLAVTPTRGKVPLLKEWAERRLTSVEIDKHFVSGVNVGVLNGAASGGLVDVDLDYSEAIACAPIFLPTTPVVFGRPSKRRSHYEYLTEGAGLKATQFRDEHDEVLVEFRSSGQTVWPRSWHPSGEPVTFSRPHVNGPTTWPTPAQKLWRQVALVAACSLIARHWPIGDHTGRHTLALAYGGFFGRAGMDVGLAVRLIVTAAEIAGDAELDDRERAVRDSFERAKSGGIVTGTPRLADVVGDGVVKRLREWLRLNVPERTGTWTVEKLRERFKTAPEHAAETPATVEWAVRPWAAFGAMTEIVGKLKKAGKSRLIAGMVRAMVGGGAFLDEPTIKTNVVWLSEQPWASFQEILHDAGLLDRPELTVLRFHDVIGVDWEMAVEAAILEAEARHARVLIVDTLGQFAGLRGDSENDAGAALEALQPIQRALEKGIAVIVVRHERKMGGEVGDSARGSTAFSGAVDISITVRRPAGDTDSETRVREIETLSRFKETPTHLFIELGKDGRYVSHGSEANYAVERAALAFRAALPVDPELAVSLDALCKLAEVSRTTGQRAIEMLQDRKEIAVVGLGKRGDPIRYHSMFSALPIGRGSGQNESQQRSTDHSGNHSAQSPLVRSGQKATARHASRGSEASEVLPTPAGSRARSGRRKGEKSRSGPVSQSRRQRHLGARQKSRK